MLSRVYCAALLFAVSVVTPATGAMQPEPQAWRDGPGVSPPTSTFGIYVRMTAPSDYVAVAGKLAEWSGTGGMIRDLSQLGQFAENQIVIGDPAVSSRIQSLAGQHGLSTLDLGTQGYELDSRVPPDGTCAWRVLIVANGPAGARAAAATLVDKMVAGTSFPEVRIRDYPDRAQQGFLYSAGTVGLLANDSYDVHAWMDEQRAAIDEMAKRGINTIYWQSYDWFQLQGTVVAGQQYPDNRRGARFRELFDYCRSIGIEPVPLIILNDPPGGAFQNADHALYREGKLINGERFFAQQGQELVSVIGNFDNSGENLDWICDDPSSGLPCQWFRQGSQPNPWTWSSGAHQVTLSGYDGGPWKSAELATTAPIVPGSYYVLRVVVNQAAFSTSNCPIGHNCRPNVHVQDHGEADPWIKYCYLRPSTEPLTYELPFLAPADKLNGNEIDIVISSNEGSGVTLVVSSISLDRRDAGFVNLMIDNPSTFNGETFPGLPVVVTSDDDAVVYQNGVDYSVLPDLLGRQMTWEMSSDGPRYRIRWNAPTPAWPMVRVRSTLGVPADHPGGNSNATTWCFSHGKLYEEYDRVFRDFYGAPGFGLNPKFIHLDMDEVRGMNRCGRCDIAKGTYGRGLTNRDYLLDHMNRMQTIVGLIPGGEQTRLLFYADMLNPWQNGGFEDYQSTWWLGQLGASRVDNADMEDLDSDIILHMWGLDDSNEALHEQWPAGHSFLAGPESDHVPEPWAREPGWYGPNGIGYAVLKWTRYALPTASDDRMLDYAWKRYSSPDATIQAFVGSDFKGDDAIVRDINVYKNSQFTVVPFGRKSRDIICGGATVTGATINWGDNTPVTTVTEPQLNSTSFNHYYNQTGLKTVTLTVNANPCNGESSKQAFLTVRVLPLSGCTKNCPTESNLVPSESVDLAARIRAVIPNPSRDFATIHFTVPKATEPEFRVFDVHGRRVVDVRLAEHGAGAWQWSWDGRDDEGRVLGAGVYFVEARLGVYSETRRIIKLDR